ncbi:hypothetical protein BN1058_02714 [Paraliobacillus sp. PM-2]|uniref:hypothetical protein n=1 Tax=Paraliobacillus sp. PM-2 TaxID=1462524 RepID=UPI00061BD908|nr:hypothetical protein [Paraliobacillus sp. PM-2]CQR48346.1 hypothetical protein BN1058_02714 [Paraliobacillus sp. PM-2]
MKKKLIAVFSLVLLLFLVACQEDDKDIDQNDEQDSKDEVLTPEDLQSEEALNELKLITRTNREETIIDTLADQAFIFEFQIDESYKDLKVWVETYQLGEKQDIDKYQKAINKSGTIIFSNTAVGGENINNQRLGIISDNGGGYTSYANELTMFDEYGFTAMPDVNDATIEVTEEPIVLAGLLYGENEVQSLPPDFFNNSSDNMDALKDYELAYILKAQFSK